MHACADSASGQSVKIYRTTIGLFSIYIRVDFNYVYLTLTWYYNHYFFLNVDKIRLPVLAKCQTGYEKCIWDSLGTREPVIHTKNVHGNLAFPPYC